MKPKPEQASSDPKQPSRATNPNVTPASPVEGDTPKHPTTKYIEGYRVEPNDPPTWTIMNPSRTMRKPPDIEALARLGGLPESVKPYELAYRNKDGSLYATCYGNSTATVTNYVTLGYAKVVDAARGFRTQYSDADASEIRDQVKHLDCVDEEWIEKNILHSARSSAELAAELKDLAIADIPEVSRWGSVAPVPEETAAPPKTASPPANKFVRVGKTWEIEFGEESCRLPASLIGLDYIPVLLQCAGEMITAVKLRETGASAVPVDIGTLEELRDDSDPDVGAALQTEWRSDLVLDEKARSEYEGELKELREKIVIAQDTGNLAEVSNLIEEAEFITAELRKQSKKTGTGRQFSTQQENARTTVTHAIKRAVEEIAKYAPATAQHLQLNIITGTTLTYRDQSVRWKT